jgi:plastocyanin
MSYPTLQQPRQGLDYGNESDVQSLHAALRHEKRDERVTIKPFSLWVLVVFGIGFFLAGFWSARVGTHFTATSIQSGNAPVAQSTPAAVQPGATPASVAQSAAANANATAVIRVVMKNMKFDPPKLEIHKGDTVEWTNEDITPHTATARPLFDSGPIASDQSWRHTFTEAGDFPYTCTFHPEMKAVVTVK